MLVLQHLVLTNHVPTTKAIGASDARFRHKKDNDNADSSHLLHPSPSGDSIETCILNESDIEEETILTVVFISFICSTQKEFLTTLEQVSNLVYNLNQQYMPKECSEEFFPYQPKFKDQVTKSYFLHYLLSDVNNLLDPIYGKLGVQDMTQPLLHYCINTI